MKLSKSVLAGSLATAGIVLGAIAPALTAQAATTTGSVDDNGNVTGLATADDAAKHGGLAIAYEDGGKTTTTSEATMNSNANVKVADGVLMLNEVPDFGFGTAAIGSKVNLQENKYSNQESESNNNSAVQIIDSRKSAAGFKLTAGITGFSSTDKSAAVQPFTLNLGKTALLDGDGANITTANTGSAANDALNTDAISISGKDADAVGDPGTIATLAKDTYKTGVINASYAPKDDNVSLDLSKGSQISGTTPSVKSYNAKITWTLTATPTVEP
ncbi:WxL domain-containing protein [Companilactobacillus kimchii]|uniref:WxL domain-containing protein n=2 Tax=Companilactobacillus kimchii TaxID=2801452 RepID=A0ABR5NR77_9LACO|nr:WxL domain-containing protein [Companilactobacillus kimchii]GEO47970.1 hypothetical protein LKI01_19690 [Companilactobacillus paralimentarius]KAE9557309.1 hypothetical protein ATN91_03970 [Companilactobacillus kimchii]KAE9559250.1 hypothetical protein ATN91_11400 [Companilactobacillus kimchii]KRK50499.1 hypothetical protein FC97_GL001422 [Companilactobacillus kimchii DSM 13961 = JCM 10707]OWF33767.1 hypothetical protein LKACC12383_00907 [Companilactobacillus kimchii]